MLHKVCKTKFCVSESEHVRKCHVEVSWQMFTVRLNLWTNFTYIIIATYFMCYPPVFICDTVAEMCNHKNQHLEF